jgi:ABC-type transport system involved in multi-copper enzyme maturation permease subunit
MIWLTWRQFRGQAITAAAALAAFAIVLAVGEPSLSGVYHSSGFASCHGAACTGLASTFINDLSSGAGIAGVPETRYMILYFLSVMVILIAPAIIGIFWGAPLIARELETGTFRLTWNQSITRTRWLAVKLALIGVAAMAVTEAFSLIQAWWAAPIGKAVGLGGGGSIFGETRFGVFVFPTHGITPLGYAAFGFALGVTVGLLVRRAVPAMAITLAIFAAAQFVTPLVRPNLFPTSQTVATIAAAGANVSLTANPSLAFTATSVPGHPGSWIISSEGVNVAGQPVSSVPAACEALVPQANVTHRGPRTNVAHRGGGPTTSGPGSNTLNNCVAGHGIRVAESYQPAGHYWPLQWSETGLFLALALALTGFCFWRLNRRRT